MTNHLFAVIIVIFSSVLSLSSTPQVPGQGIRTGSPKDRSIEDKYRADEIERVRREAVKPQQRYQTTRFPQIKEDFERIQLINSDVLQAISLKAEPDYRRLSEAAAEVKKRATRLRTNLFPSESRVESKQSEPRLKGPENLKALLNELDKAITTFVHNPMFENTRVVNEEDSKKAQEDLEKIIDLSARTRKRAG
ncbi:MAG TPA: hypothetical protein VFH01_06920 [Pyrinomonadaceae bacterium]|nr:hypothetical protein [Pyrinomonadaceae bacterium]